MPRLTAYFAHPFKTMGSEEEKRIIEILEGRRILVYEPFGKEIETMKKKYNRDNYYDGPIYWEMAREVWTKDIGAVKKCDILVGYLPYPTIGTSAEIATAYECGKFIQLISPYKHPSFSVYADQLFETIDDFDRLKVYKWVNYK